MNIVDWVQWGRDGREVISYDLDTMTEDERAVLFKDRLDNHDFWYNYSDDHSVWMRGERESLTIEQIAKTLPARVTNLIWNAYILRIAGGSEEKVNELGLRWNRYKDVE